MPEATHSLLDQGGRVLRELARQQGLAYRTYGEALQRFGEQQIGWTELFKTSGDIYFKETAQAVWSLIRANANVYALDAVRSWSEARQPGSRACARRGAFGQAGAAGSRLSDVRPEVPRVAIVDEVALTPTRRLAAALDRAGFWDILKASLQGQPAEARRLLIKPELAGFTAGSPQATDPFLVESLIDLLHDRGFANVAVVGTADSSAFWAENRDLYALSDLLGYRFVTPKGRAYDVVDLADAPDEAVFALGSALLGAGISRAWVDADFRIVFSKNRTDEEAGYALALDTLIGVLPLPDKTLHYRRRRHPGDVAAALLAAAPVHFVLIDAITSAHGPGGRRSADPIDTDTLIAASHIVLADYVGALKMGLDPAVSPILARVLRGHPLPTQYTVSGTLAPYSGWRNVSVPVLRSTQTRAGAAALDRLVGPWLQRLDPELFPLRNPLDARLNATLAEFFADAGDSPTSQYLADPGQHAARSHWAVCQIVADAIRQGCVAPAVCAARHRPFRH